MGLEGYIINTDTKMMGYSLKRYK